MLGGNFLRIKSFRTNGVDVGTSAVAVRNTTDMDKYMYVIVKNAGSGDVFIGNSDTVTTASGFKLGAGESIEMLLTTPTQIYAIAAAAGEKVTVMEYELETY